jgi:hypothetical protein
MFQYSLLVLLCGVVVTQYLTCGAFAPILPSNVPFDRSAQLFAKPQRLTENVDGVVYVNDRVSRRL